MAAVILRLSKHHSAGNDFLVALVSVPFPGSDSDPARELFGDPATAAVALCHRRRGIGADGLVLGVESANQARMPAEGDGGDGETLDVESADQARMPTERKGDGGVEEIRSDSVRMPTEGEGGGGVEALDVQAGSVRMRLWNSDGSEAEISGNGLRCLAQAVARYRGVSEIDIDTPAGLRRCWIETDGGSDAGLATGRVEMGAVILDALDCAVATKAALLDAQAEGAVTLDALDGVVATAESGPGQLAATLNRVEGFTGRWRTGSVGNPHVVVEVVDPDAIDLEAAGPKVEACFAGGANVHFAATVGFRRLSMRIWERGAGVTESCGSGAAVAAAVFDAWEAWADPDGAGAEIGSTARVGEGDVADVAAGYGVSGAARVRAAVGAGDRNGAGEIVVAMPGGETRVHLGPSVALTGPVVHVADIEIPDVRLLC